MVQYLEAGLRRRMLFLQIPVLIILRFLGVIARADYFHFTIHLLEIADELFRRDHFAFSIEGLVPVDCR